MLIALYLLQSMLNTFQPHNYLYVQIVSFIFMMHLLILKIVKKIMNISRLLLTKYYVNYEILL